MTRPSTRSTRRYAHSVLVVSGFGLRLFVERGHLIVEDGIADERRRRCFTRIEGRVKRVVVLGHSGTVTLDALQWLHDVGAAFVQLGTDGRVVVASAPSGPDVPQLRRAQANAVHSGAGEVATRFLLDQKLAGQAEVVGRLPTGALVLPTIESYRKKLAHVTTEDELRLLEAQAARVYWDAWACVPVRFHAGKANRVPEHWRMFGSRTSPLSNSGRRAANPANALLNYLYAILEAEARIAAITMGCDPGLGVFHADSQSRDSFACDLMEAVRPAVDAFLLDFLRRREFDRADFFERHDGGCRLLPPLTHDLAKTGRLWAKLLGPITEQVARILLEHPAQPGPSKRQRWKAPPPKARKPVPLPTPLTQEHRRAVQAPFRAEPVPETKPVRPPFNPLPTLGAPRTAQPLRPPSDDESRARFYRELVPQLRQVPAEALAKATGLSVVYCNKIRSGACLPHRRHWAGLVGVITTEP